VKAASLSAARADRVSDYLELTKPRLTGFVLVVVGLSAWLGGGAWVHAVLGTALVAAGASALNMFMERERDTRMPRTWGRPLPSGRLSAPEVLAFGIATTALGLGWLAAFTTPLATLLAALTSATYLGLYTPLKRVTTLNTHFGAVPGALPALIGWAAARDTLDAPAWTLFLIVYLWQLPHFLSIAWLYRADYARGGFRMLPSADPLGLVTARQALLGALALVPVSLLPTYAGFAGGLYLVAALFLGAWFVARAASFLLARTEARARALMRASLVYLPLLLLALFVDS